MMCQSSGCPPISTIGLGRVAVSSASRVPSPPASSTTFMLSHHPRLGYGTMNRPAAIPVRLLLAHDLVGEIPREDQHVVGPPLVASVVHGRTGDVLPGVNRPTFSGFLSTVNGSRRVSMPQ